LKPFGPYQCFKCPASVNTFHTSSRGASKSREMTKSGLMACARFVFMSVPTLRFG
jgi:hypothetical protein